MMNMTSANSKISWLSDAHEDIEKIFRIILPQHGREPRDGQIELCHMQSIVEQGETEESHIADFAMIANAINVLRLQKAEVEQDTLRQENTEARLAAMRERLRSMDISLKAYDDRLVWQMVENIKVLSRDQIQIRFKVGIKMTMGLVQE